MTRAILQLGDEILCGRCKVWHATEQPTPDDPRDYLATALYFRCPAATGLFYAGRVGEPPHDLARWRRGSSIQRERASRQRPQISGDTET